MEDWTKREEYRNPCNIWEQSIILEEIEAHSKRHKEMMEGIANNLKQYEKDIRKQVCQEVLAIIDENFNCYGYVEEKFDNIKKYVEAQIQGETECQKK